MDDYKIIIEQEHQTVMAHHEVEADYIQNPYKYLFEYIENGCQKIGEKRDFVKYLHSMEQSDSMEQLMSIYNNIFKLLAVIFFGTNKMPSKWYQPKTWGHNKGYLVEELNCFLNENILKWFQRQENKTYKQFTLCLSNLRDSDNTVRIKDQLLQYSGYASSLSQIVKKHFSIRQKIELGNLDVIQNEYKKLYIKISKNLAGHGRIFDVAEVAFGEEYGISYDGLAEEYKKDIEEEEKREEEKLLMEKKEKKKDIIKYISFLVCFLFIFLSLCISNLNIALIIGAFFVAFYLLLYMMQHMDSRQFANMNKGINTVGDFMLSGLFALPFGFFGGIFSSMKKRR